ncbi:TetR/AcrR family transcriptional regulator [Mycolicibacterium neoaurum]|uniref:TetR/AcrR family transcriptional regulator n=1 Tax=Mycolicibacterium neoaurum TaxID=1795 RepID=UPI0006898E2E|nr:TetR/AcrR family transcriptional regulator [Mycolicibacterium neoaurum]SDE48116.1 DNA-binding transcriptional regulator, AcrR family [Mycolicibacterium neoaurum]
MLSNDPAADERGSIVEATFACLAEPHDGPISVAAILSRAGVSSRAFYRHYQSKDELFLAMLDDVTRRLAVRLDEIAAGVDAAPLDRLRAWLDQMFTLAVDTDLHRYLAVLDCDEMRSAKGYREARELSRSRRESSLVEILAAGRADGSFPLAEPDSDAIAIAALVSRELTSTRIFDADQVPVARARVEGFALRALGVSGHVSGGGGP